VSKIDKYYHRRRKQR